MKNKSDLPNLSYEFLEHEFGYYGLTNLAEIADSIKVRGWTERMSKKYCFSFPGAKELFAEKINHYLMNDKEAFRFQDYLIDISENNFCFGIARGGHSGGYWFVPQVTEQNGNLMISGRIEYSAYRYDETRTEKLLNKIDEFFLYVILSPLILIRKAYQLIKKLIYKIRHKPFSREETEEDRLFYLIETILGCTRI